MIERLKFQPPMPHVDLILRPEVTERLNRGLHRACTLVCAPAGYGKTTLVAQWLEDLEQTQWHSLWITLDETDRVLDQFVLTIHECLQDWCERAEINLGFETERLGNSRRPIAALEAMLYLLSQSSLRAVIVLDDYNRVRSEELDAVVDTLLARLPENLHLVIVSRESFHLSRTMLLAQGQLTEVTAEDLEFSDRQVKQLLDAAVQDDSIQAIVQKASGWPIVIQLLKICIQTRNNQTDISQSVEDSAEVLAVYLTQQVMSILSERAQSLMTSVSIVDEINVDLANAICGFDDSAVLLDEIGRIDPLVRPAGNDRTWLRFHQLLRDYLHQRLATRGKQQLCTLQNRASHWFEEQGLYNRAVRHAVLAHDLPRAAGLIETAGAVRVALVGSLSELEKMLVLLPLEEVYRHPRLHVARVWVLAKHGHLREARDCFEAVRREVDNSQDSFLRMEALFVDSMMTAVYEDEAWKPNVLTDMEALARIVSPVDHWLQGWIHNILCVIYTRRGSFTEARTAAQSALRHYENAESAYGSVFMQFHLALINLLEGKINDARAIIAAAREAAESRYSSDSGLLGLINVLSAQIDYEQNRLGLAEEELERALPMIQVSEGWVEVYIGGFRVMSGIRFAGEGLSTSLEVLEIARSLAQKRGLQRLRWCCDCREVELLTHNGDLESAVEFARKSNAFLHENVPKYLSWREQRAALAAQARLSLYRDRLDESLAISGKLEEVGLADHHLPTLLDAYVLKALAHFKAENQTAAIEALQSALDIAVPEGMVRHFVEEGSAMARLLQFNVRHLGVAGMPEATVNFIAEVISSLKSGGASVGGDAGTGEAPSILSTREMEVLRQLSQGHVTKIIARNLDLSVATVKFHLGNIYKKLGVSSQKLALAVAREKHLI